MFENVDYSEVQLSIEQQFAIAAMKNMVEELDLSVPANQVKFKEMFCKMYELTAKQKAFLIRELMRHM